jgi:hypothetical protein
MKVTGYCVQAFNHYVVIKSEYFTMTVTPTVTLTKFRWGTERFT